MLDHIKPLWKEEPEKSKAPTLKLPQSTSELEKRVQAFNQYEWGRIPSLVFACITLIGAVFGIAKLSGGADPEKWAIITFISAAWSLNFFYRFAILHIHRPRPEQSLREYLQSSITRLQTMRITQRIHVVIAGLLLVGILGRAFQPEEGLLDTFSLIGVLAYALISFFLLALVFWYQKHFHTGSKKDLVKEFKQLLVEMD